MSVAEMTEAQFRELFDSVSNWGRWSDDGGRGALNHLTPARIAAVPSSTKGVGFPMHVLAINAMGVFVAAPLRVVGGTGSPINPIAVF